MHAECAHAHPASMHAHTHTQTCKYTCAVTCQFSHANTDTYEEAVRCDKGTAVDAGVNALRRCLIRTDHGLVRLQEQIRRVLGQKNLLFVPFWPPTPHRVLIIHFNNVEGPFTSQGLTLHHNAGVHILLYWCNSLTNLQSLKYPETDWHGAELLGDWGPG